MKFARNPNFLRVAGLVALGGAIGFSSSYFHHHRSQERTMTITAHQYAYDPSVIQVDKGDRVRIHFVSKDVTHGLYLAEYDLDAKARPEDPTFWLRHPSQKGEEYQPVQEIEFVANRAGKFQFRCSITCGYMHPFMNGVLIVRPNYLYSSAVGLALGLVVAMLMIVRSVPAGGQT